MIAFAMFTLQIDDKSTTFYAHTQTYFVFYTNYVSFSTSTAQHAWQNSIRPK